MKLTKVKIYGAGSVGNHFANACRELEIDVTVIDPDAAALKRMKSELYPSRYGSWDDKIVLSQDNIHDQFDLTIIGTPPEFHTKIALSELEEGLTKCLLIEKPLSFPKDKLLEKSLFEKSSIPILIGYNHNLSPAINFLKEKIISGELGEVYNVEVSFRENINYILAAHPWLASKNSSYLGQLSKGGGAAFEHSHGLAMWLYLSEFWVDGEISADSVINKAEGFDELACFNLSSNGKYIGKVIQDFKSTPALKECRVFGTNGYMEWKCANNPKREVVTIENIDGVIVKDFLKQRSTDFVQELKHINDILEGQILPESSPISFSKGMRVYKVLNSI